MVWASILITGMNLSLRLKIRKDFLGEIVVFLMTAIVEIDYISLPVTEILKKVRSNGACKKLDFIGICIDETEKGEDFDFAWSRAVDLSALPFTAEEQKKLISLGSLIGTSDVAGQRSILTLYSDTFREYHRKAEEIYTKYGKICIVVSGFLGMGIFVLMI